MLSVLLFLAIQAPRIFALEPGCSNARFENAHIVADCLDPVTGNPFLYVDLDDRYGTTHKASIVTFAVGAEAPPVAQGVCHDIYRAWTVDNGTAKTTSAPAQCRRGRRRRRDIHGDVQANTPHSHVQPYVPDSVHSETQIFPRTPEELYSNMVISLEDLVASEEGTIGSVEVAAGSVSSLASTFKCDVKNYIPSLSTASDISTIAVGGLSLGMFIMAAVGLNIAKAGSGADRDTCTMVGRGSKVCASYARDDAMYSNDQLMKQAIDQCLSTCVSQQQSCQISWTSETQQNNCKPWWCPWCDYSPCPIEKHSNNICISNRPNGCKYDSKLDVDPKDPNPDAGK